jgi:iron complex transport system substrate-binding protein
MKVVSLCPSLTDIAVHLGGQGALCGVTDYCPEIEGAVRLGSPKALKLEEIVRLAPDLILADMTENRPEELRPLQQKFKVEVYEVRSVQAVMDATATMGRSLGRIPQANAFVEEIRKVADEVKRNTASETPLRTLILLWNTPFLTVNFDTYASRLIETCGAYNVFHQDPVHEIPIEIEDMIDNNPQLLLLASEPYPFKKRHIKNFRDYRIFSKIPIELVSGHYLSRYGPLTLEALRFFESLILKHRSAGVVS